MPYRFVFLFSIAVIALPNLAVAQAAPQDVLRSFGGNSGLYDNRIPDVDLPVPYTEICIVGDSVVSETHPSGGDTGVPPCLPGAVGWIIEQEERPAKSWEMARMECLRAGMRLPEPFEWKFSCVNAAAYGLNDMTGGAHEWASNQATPIFAPNSNNSGTAASIFGEQNCLAGSWGWVAVDSAVFESVQPFRCVR